MNLSSALLAPFFAPRVPGLDDTEQATLDRLVAQWSARRPRNMTRLGYLDLKANLKDLQATLPPEIVSQLDVVIGWPLKAVDELANRIVLDGFQGADANPLGLTELLEANLFDVEFPQAVTSSLSQSVSFVTATRPDGGGVQIHFYSALWATGLWDRQRRSLSSGLAILDADNLQRPTRLALMVPDRIIYVAHTGDGWEIEDEQVTGLGDRIPMEPLPFQPTLERPFGRSRIDRQVMSVTDRAMRAAARLEIHSELFSAVKLILMGADKSAFEASSWSWLMDRLNTITKDEDGDLPRLEQVRAESPEPHIAVMRQLASEFSGHTGVPLSSLGISTQNVESAQAKQEAREDIIGHAERQHKIWGAALRRVFGTAIMLRDGLDEPPPELRSLGLAWRPPNRPTLASLADAGAKQVAAIPGLADTTVGMELIGLTPQQIERFQSERALAAPTGLDALAAAIGRGNATAGA